MSGWCANYLAAARVRPGERLRVVVDVPFAAEGEELAQAARALAMEARVARFPARRPMLEPTSALLDTAAWADVSIGLLRYSYVDEIPARRAMVDVLLAHGGRALSSSDIDRETLYGELSQPIPDVGAGLRAAGACRGCAGTPHLRRGRNRSHSPRRRSSLADGRVAARAGWGRQLSRR